MKATRDVPFNLGATEILQRLLNCELTALESTLQTWKFTYITSHLGSDQGVHFTIQRLIWL